MIFALLLMSAFVFSSAPWVSDKKTVMFEIGFVIAKKPVKTAIENVIKSSIMLQSNLTGTGFENNHFLHLKKMQN